MGTVWPDFDRFANYLTKFRSVYPKMPLVCTSMPADGLHVGHLRMLKEMAAFTEKVRGENFVIVNSDEFLIRKKGFCYMTQAHRMEILAGLECVDNVVSNFEDGGQTVAAALAILRPTYFMKGGNYSQKSDIHPDEVEACERFGIEIITGVGGPKVESSSDLVARARLSSSLRMP